MTPFQMEQLQRLKDEAKRWDDELGARCEAYTLTPRDRRTMEPINHALRYSVEADEAYKRGCEAVAVELYESLLKALAMPAQEAP
jgi:hypothetical protein